MWRAGATLRCSAWASHCSGFSCCGAQALGIRASAVAARGLSICGSRALEHRLSSCGSWAWLLRDTWDLPGPGLEAVSPALAGGFLTTAPPGKSQKSPSLKRREFTHCNLHPLVYQAGMRATGLDWQRPVWSVPSPLDLPPGWHLPRNHPVSQHT